MMLRPYGWADFNQGLEAARVTPDIAALLVSIGRPVCRFSVDGLAEIWAFDEAYCHLRRAGLPKSLIRVYCLIGFDTDPGEAWRRCRLIERYGIKPLPMWFHELNAMEENAVTEHQEKDLGWSDYERRRIMQWFYQHKEAVPA